MWCYQTAPEDQTASEDEVENMMEEERSIYIIKCDRLYQKIAVLRLSVNNNRPNFVVRGQKSSHFRPIIFYSNWWRVT